MTAPFAGYQQSLAYTAAKDRALLGAGMVRKSLTPRDGCIPGGSGTENFDVSIAGLNATIAPGEAMVAGYTVIAPAATVVPVAPGGGSARRDLIVLRVYDAEAGDALSQAKIELVQGTTSSDPVVPARSLVLYAIDMAAGAGSIAGTTDRRYWTASTGGVRIVSRGISDADPLDMPGGSLVYDSTTQDRFYYRRLTSLVPIESSFTRTGRVDRVIEGNGFLRILPNECWFGDNNSVQPRTITGWGIDNRFMSVTWSGMMDGAGCLLDVWDGNGRHCGPGELVAVYFTSFR